MRVEVPRNQPFVVYARFGTRGLVLGGLVAAAIVGSIALIAVSAMAGLPIAPFLAILGCPAALVTVFAALMLRQVLGGPLLAAGPAGIWLTSAGEPVHLPWQAITQISTRRTSLFDQTLVITTHGASRVPGVVDALYGTGFRVDISMADQSRDDIMTALAYYSAGRCPVR